MDIQKLHKIIIEGVSANTALLTDFLPGSINYTVTRGLAGALLDIYQKIEELEPNFFLTTAEGESLDKLGNSINITRIKGNSGVGYVLAQNTDIKNIIIPTRLVLTNPNTLKQYIVTEDKNINIASYSEERIKIESVENNSDSNIEAGTMLISAQFPTINFIIGSYRSSSGQITGSIKDGISAEPDLIYRQRIIDTLLKPTNNYFFIKQLLINLGDINNVLFFTTEAGKVDIWLEPKTNINTIRLAEIQNILDFELPLGIVSTAKILIKNQLNFKVKVYDFSLEKSRLDNLKDSIILYLRNLDYRSSLIIKELEDYLKIKTNLVLEVIAPLDKIILFTEGETFTFNSLEVVYNA